VPQKMGYNHFCTHTRSPMPFGKWYKLIKCNPNQIKKSSYEISPFRSPNCLKCYLFFANTAREDEKLVEAAKVKATAAAMADDNDEASDLTDDKVGPPAAKRQKKGESAALGDPFVVPIVAPPVPIVAPPPPMVHAPAHNLQLAAMLVRRRGGKKRRRYG